MHCRYNFALELTGAGVNRSERARRPFRENCLESRISLPVGRPSAFHGGLLFAGLLSPTYSNNFGRAFVIPECFVGQPLEDSFELSICVSIQSALGGIGYPEYPCSSF